jgi:hypothetical protein
VFLRWYAPFPVLYNNCGTVFLRWVAPPPGLYNDCCSSSCLSFSIQVLLFFFRPSLKGCRWSLARNSIQRESCKCIWLADVSAGPDRLVLWFSSNRDVQWMSRSPLPPYDAQRDVVSRRSSGRKERGWKIFIVLSGDEEETTWNWSGQWITALIFSTEATGNGAVLQGVSKEPVEFRR